MLFPLEHRNTAFVTLGLIGKMLQSFIVGTADWTADFRGQRGDLWVAARSVLLLRGLSQRVPEPGSVFGDCAGDGAADPSWTWAARTRRPRRGGVCVVGMHLLALNVLYPKLLGSRLKINPLAVTIALLFWGAVWGAVGLVLAIPITGALKIICDHVESMKTVGRLAGGVKRGQR